jgi:dihydropteroate synthase
MGVLNVTPDSFSDGGRFLDAKAAIEGGMRMVDEGADLIDVGGESTRPGAEPVSADEELRRVLPVVEELTRRGVQVSVDTMKSGVARAAVDSGARIVNDVSGLRDPEMVAVCVAVGCDVVIMHMRGEPRTMQVKPQYDDVVLDVRDYLVAQAQAAMGAGIEASKIWIDPGIGFGKTVNQNLLLIREMGALVETGYPVVVGVSRKSFLGKILGSADSPVPVEDRLEASLAMQALAQTFGAKMIRAHDVRQARRTIDAVAAVLAVRMSSE